MTDKEKLTALRAEIERRISSINNREHKIHADKVAVIQLEAVLSLYDSLQEEPVSNSDWLTELQEKLDNATPEQLEELWNKYNGVDEEEPISEDLEEEIRKYLLAYKGYPHVMDDTERGIKDAAIHFANWQAEQFEKNRLAACDAQTGEEAEIEHDFVMSIIENEHRQPTFDDAIKYGMRLQRENMMKDATDVTVHIEAGNYPYIPQLELYDYDKDIPLAKEGDKYKVVLIKEE